MHHGLADGVREKRKQILAAAFAAHPERFVRGTPQLADLPQAVWINPPEKKPTHQDAPGSTQRTADDLRVDPICRTYSPWADSSIVSATNPAQH